MLVFFQKRVIFFIDKLEIACEIGYNRFMIANIDTGEKKCCEMWI